MPIEQAACDAQEDVHEAVISQHDRSATCSARPPYSNKTVSACGISMPNFHILLFLAAMQMGPSGSGKTTLLDVLAGRKTVGQTEGAILFGGQKPTPAFLRR